VAKEMSVEATTEQRMMHKQCRDVAYCLSQLSYTNFAPLKKLIDCYRFYSNKVGDKEVYNSFVTVLNKGRKFAKAETKQLLDEFEIKLREAHEKALEEDQVDYKASTSSRSTGRRGKASIEVSVISIAEEEEEEEEEEVVPVAMKAAAKKPPAKKKAPPKKKKKQESSSEEEEEEEEESVEGSDLDEEA
jgi:condensin complex subunit 1